MYLARLHDTKQLLAFKVMRKSKLVSVGEEKPPVTKTRAHGRLNGPFATLFHSYDDPTAYYLLTEYAPCGDLFQCLSHGLPSLGCQSVHLAGLRGHSLFAHEKIRLQRFETREHFVASKRGRA